MDFLKSEEFMSQVVAYGTRAIGALSVLLAAWLLAGWIGRITAGVSDDLSARAAGVVLKERRRLIVVPRDTPLSLIHLRNMVSLTEAGGIVCPAIPSFYSEPESFEALAATVIDRVLDLGGFELHSYRWGENEDGSTK